MKRWKKILLVLFGIILLAQTPFIYNLYLLGQLWDKINLLQTQRTENANPNFNDFKGITHAHTSLGGHSTGSFAELLKGATANELNFVIMTEHTDALYDTSMLNPQGVYLNILFVNGQEVPTATDRFLQLPGDPESSRADKMDPSVYLQTVQAKNKLAIMTYPENSKSIDTNFDGIEILNLYSNSRKVNKVTAFFYTIWSHYSYPELILAQYLQRPDDNLVKFDKLTATKRLTATAGTDAHSNIGFHFFGDDAGHKFINFKIDSYQTVFRLFRNHVLLEKDKPLTQENLLQAIKNGHLFIGLDLLGDTKGFSFTAENGAETKITGDEIALRQGINFKVSAPLAARFVIFKNGEKVFETNDTTETVFQAKESGTYRTEVYLDTLGAPFDRMPWIFSNPIYVR